MTRYNFSAILLILLAFNVSTLCQSSSAAWKIKVGSEKGQFPVVDAFNYYDFEVYQNELILCDMINSQVWRIGKDGIVLDKYALPSRQEIIHRYKDDLFVLLTNGQLIKIHIPGTDHHVIELKLPVSLSSSYEVIFWNNSLIVPCDNVAQGDAFSINLDTISKVEVIKGMYNFDKRFEKQLNQQQKEQFKHVNVCGCSNDAIVLGKHIGKEGYPGKNEYFYLNNKANIQTPLNCLSEELTGLILDINVCRGFKIYTDALYCIGMTYVNGMEDYLIVTRINHYESNSR